MCYSEQLTREAGAHLIDGVGWLLVGYKAVRPPADDERPEDETAPSWWSLFGVPRGGGYYEPYRYPLRQLVSDDHGYHLAATPEGAWEAARRLLTKQPGQIEQVQICRMLVPEDLVNAADHHCYEAYMIPPGETESAEDIKRASRGMRRRAKLRAWRCAAAKRLIELATAPAVAGQPEPAQRAN